MGKKRTEETRTNTFDYETPSITPQIQAAPDMKAQPDLTIPFGCASRKQELENSYNNSLGSYTAPAVREAVRRSAGGHLSMNEAQATQASQYQADNTDFARSMTKGKLGKPGNASSGAVSVGV